MSKHGNQNALLRIAVFHFLTYFVKSVNMKKSKVQFMLMAPRIFIRGKYLLGGNLELKAVYKVKVK
jgi:hypothetical protein